jgi:hypothetical protein
MAGINTLFPTIELISSRVNLFVTAQLNSKTSLTPGVSSRRRREYIHVGFI